MNFNQILNDVLGAVKNVAGEQLNKKDTSSTIAKVGSGAAIAGVLSMILGKNGGAKLAKLGSLAALGSIAYQAYQNYQQQQKDSETLPEQSFTQTENASVVILKAMIAAAAADGVITDEERAQIRAEGGSDPELEQWLAQEFAQPASVAEIAELVGNDTALASQVYLAARMVCKELSRKEIVFLAQLASALGLDDHLVEQLEQQAGY